MPPPWGRCAAHSDGPGDRPFLGVQIEAAKEGGVAIRRTVTGTAAAEAGLEAGDVIVRVDGESLDTPDQLTAAILRHRPGAEHRLHIVFEAHEGCDRRVPFELGQIVFDLLDGLVHGAPQVRTARFVDVRRGVVHIAELPNVLHEATRAENAATVPRSALRPIERKHHVGADGVCTIFGYQFVGVHGVAASLGHSLNVEMMA